MKAIIKHFHSPDIENLHTFTAPDDKFSFLLQLYVGLEGKEGEESFDVMIVSSKWVVEYCKNNNALLGRHYLIMHKYDFSLIEAVLTKYIEKCTGSTWDEIATKIARVGMWEFEDYKP